MSGFPSGDISAAVDRAASTATETTPASTGQSTSTDSPAPSTAEPGSGAPAEPTADRPGPGRQPARARSRGADDTATRATGQIDASTSVPPQDRWPSILENQRTEAQQQLNEDYGIGDRYTPDVVRSFGAMLRDFPDIDPNAVIVHATRLRTDPVEYYHALGAQLARAGVLASPDASQSTRREPGAVERPKPSYEVEGVPFYSGPEMEAYVTATLNDFLARIENRLGPIEADRMESDAKSYVREQMDMMKSWRFFDDPKFRERMGRLMQADKRLNIEGAYNRAVQERLKSHDDEVASKARESTIKDLKQQPDPNTARPGKPMPSLGGKRRGHSMNDRVDAAVERALSDLV